jgi:hypothetical protein
VLVRNIDTILSLAYSFLKWKRRIAMEKVAGKEQAEMAMRAKKTNEFELANAIRRHFDAAPLKGELNDMVYQSIVIAKGMKGFDKVWAKNRNTLAVIRDYQTIERMETAASQGMMSAVHCGDVVRFFGEIAEEHPDLNQAREAFQVGGKDFWDKKKSANAILPQHGSQADPGTRVRLGTEHKLDPISPAMQAKMQPFGATPQDMNRTRKAHFRSLERRSAGEMSQIGAGMRVWAPQDLDILYRIEITFGLRVGATISGTTTDTLYFLSVFGRYAMDPIFYLLPLATIIAPGHHSLIEAAIPLTLAGRIDYSIGLYSTLMPQGSNSGAAAAVEKTLQQYEKDQRNRLMIVFYSQPETPGGYWQFSNKKGSPEQNLFADMGKADRELMQQFHGMGKSYLNELDLERWVRNSHLRNARAPIA